MQRCSLIMHTFLNYLISYLLKSLPLSMPDPQAFFLSRLRVALCIVIDLEVSKDWYV